MAALTMNPDAVILTHNTPEYLDCGDEHGGRVHNDYRVSTILSAGIAEPIVQPNQCTRTSALAKPGNLILFVRPWRPGEDM